ncbi:MAG: 4-hydroxy-tetrahydrodipicolinate reductase [Gammaproteobacteria bacterium]|nr:4-hydroxy-tetrahydrodipicolinate reductase [Gammaproteobacteria bacterium]NNC97287.1 4-hydroxy-tetrahydrodipicolinate reductase [Gammaproteobacteria bacterium]NNM13900.1 4-hydroxy-tetrahydrodipicolinate reductase [Gammaproteobacteria bacterium]
MQKRIAIFGAAGRMGQTLIRLIEKQEDLQLAGALDHDGSGFIGKPVSDLIETSSAVHFTSDPIQALTYADIVIDFALAKGADERIQACRSAGVPMLIGTTGLSDSQQQSIQEAGNDIPILWASNMSLGVNLIFRLASEAAKALGSEFKISIHETHHVHKLDSPSGTALSIGDVIGNAVGAVDIEYESKREGEVIGDHTVVFDSPHERIAIHHHAKNRSVFAQGALNLALRLSEKSKNCYRVRDFI